MTDVPASPAAVRPADRESPKFTSMEAAIQPAAPVPSGSVPLWFERLMVAVIAGVISLGTWGLLLAVVGQYKAELVVLLGLVTAVALSALAWPRRTAAPLAGVRWPAVAMVALAVLLYVWNGLHSGHYVVIDRDPGIYAAAAKWLEHNGSLEVSAGNFWLAKGVGIFNWASAGMYPEGLNANYLEFQFSHLAPVLFATAGSLFGDPALFAVPALLGSLGLCAVYSAGCRLVGRPWIVLAAVAALGFSLPQISVSRDTYSESSAQFFLWSGLWLLMLAFERRRLGVALLAGLAIGGTLLARVDALVYFVALPVVAIFAYAAASSEVRQFLRRMYAVVLACAAGLATLAVFDLDVRSTGYYTALGNQVRYLWLALAAATVGAVVATAIWNRSASFRQWVSGRRTTIATVLAALGVFGLILMWTLRPGLWHGHDVLNSTTGSAQAREHLPIDSAQTYSEHSMTWVTWYLGAITISLAVVGIGLLLYRMVAAPSPAVVLILTVAGAGCALYLWTPQITPTQIWAMRRFVPAALPFLVLSAAVALAAVEASLPGLRLRNGWNQLVPAAALLGVIAFPVGVTLPVANYRTQAGFLAVVNKLCETVGPNAVVVVAAKDPLAGTFPQTVRSYCHVPAARLVKSLTAAKAAALAASWQAQGQSLWIIGSSPSSIMKSVPGVAPTLVASATNNRALEETIGRPPSAYTSQTLTIYAAPVLRP